MNTTLLNKLQNTAGTISLPIAEFITIVENLSHRSAEFTEPAAETHELTETQQATIEALIEAHKSEIESIKVANKQKLDELGQELYDARSNAVAQPDIDSISLDFFGEQVRSVWPRAFDSSGLTAYEFLVDIASELRSTTTNCLNFELKCDQLQKERDELSSQIESLRRRVAPLKKPGIEGTKTQKPKKIAADAPKPDQLKVVEPIIPIELDSSEQKFSASWFDIPQKTQSLIIAFVAEFPDIYPGPFLDRFGSKHGRDFLHGHSETIQKNWQAIKTSAFALRSSNCN